MTPLSRLLIPCILYVIRSETLFQDNRASDHGGASIVKDSGTSVLFLGAPEFRNNSAGKAGALYVSGASTNVTFMTR